MPHVHNALHHFTDLQAAYRKAVGEAAADFNGIERAGETLTPTLNMWERPEWAFLRREALINAYHEQAAVALEVSFVGLRNPAGSGYLAVVQHVAFFTGVLATIQLTQGVIIATDVDGSEQVIARDTRWPLPGATPVVKIHGAGAALVGNDGFRRWIVPNSTTQLESDYEHVLHPGHELRFYVTSVNIELRCQIIGYARKALPGELE